MGESLMEPRRVDDEGRKVVKTFRKCGISGTGKGLVVTVACE